MSLTVATAQFAVTSDIAENLSAVQRLMRQAKAEGAGVVHFCEAALSSYAGVDFETFDGFDWDACQAAGGLPVERFADMEAGVGTHLLTGGTTLPAITMPAGMIAAASNNNLWISCPNASAPRSCWPSFFVRPDGVITGALEPETEGLLLSQVDLTAEIYDSTVAWRDRAIDGVLHSGELVEDPRSKARTAF
jgi:predicted amidohydrolase